MNSFASLFKKKKKEYLLGKRQQEQDVLKDGALLFQELIASCDGKLCRPIRIFSANKLIKAMDGVRHRCDIFFSQCKGTYQDRKISIKIYDRLWKHENFFINEVVSLAQINHRNVVKLLGYCLEMQSPIVVYELLPNTLSDLLYTEKPSKQISWQNRLRIAIEIADAVTYLHIAKPRPIIHRDISSSNILLDEHCRPKLSGFDLSIAIPLGETHVQKQTNDIAGTPGYVDPNYFVTCNVTEKVDVYSFGILMLEILSGKNRCEVLVEYYEKGNNVLVEQNLLEIFKIHACLPVDTRKIEQLMACVELAGRCIADGPDQRPTMKEVALKLRQIEKHQLPCSS